MIKGDRVMRIAGTSVGFRVRTYHTIEDVSRTHIKVRNDDGQISPWFLRSDFMWISAGPVRRVVAWTTVVRQLDGTIVASSHPTAFQANRYCDGQRQLGCNVLAKKRITIPYVLPDVAVGG